MKNEVNKHLNGEVQQEKSFIYQKLLFNKIAKIYK